MITYLELLELIKEGKQPEKVRFYGCEYEYSNSTYISKNDCFLSESIISTYSDFSVATIESIEIIDSTKIEEIDKYKETIDDYVLDTVVNKINELVRAVNDLVEREGK